MRADTVIAAEALSEAARWGCVEVLQILLAQPSPLSATTFDREGRTPMHRACEGGRSVEAVRMLMTLSPASVTQQDEESDRIALHYCCGLPYNEEIRADIAQLLLGTPEGKSVIDQPAADAYTPLHYAAENALVACVCVLLDAGSQG